MRRVARRRGEWQRSGQGVRWGHRGVAKGRYKGAQRVGHRNPLKHALTCVKHWKYVTDVPR